MSDVMLHGVLNMPLPDDPAECDLMTWMQFKQRARQASARVEELEAKLKEASLKGAADLGQAQYAYQAQLLAEGKLAEALSLADEVVAFGCDEDQHAEWLYAKRRLAELKGQDDG